jgi:hypothetical protein
MPTVDRTASTTGTAVATVVHMRMAPCQPQARPLVDCPTHAVATAMCRLGGAASTIARLQPCTCMCSYAHSRNYSRHTRVAGRGTTVNVEVQLTSSGGTLALQARLTTPGCRPSRAQSEGVRKCCDTAAHASLHIARFCAWPHPLSSLASTSGPPGHRRTVAVSPGRSRRQAPVGPCTAVAW